MRKCPYCDFECADTPTEIAHMNSRHPEIIAERLAQIGEPVYDPFLVTKLARECVLHFGSGFRHGDLGLSHETYEEIIRFVFAKVEVYA
jgi:hypothetical protein